MAKFTCNLKLASPFRRGHHDTHDKLPPSSEAEALIEKQENTTQNSSRTAVSKPSKPLHLLDLPADILDDIISRLDPASATCLALCSKSLSSYLTLSTSYSDWKEKPGIERAKFLALLTRNAPQIGVCWGCGTLFTPDKLRKPKDPARNRGTVKIFMYKDNAHGTCDSAQLNQTVNRMCMYTMAFEEIFLVMKAHRLGISPGPLPMEHFDHLEVGHHKRLDLTNVTTCDARIVGDEFLHRCQVWIKGKDVRMMLEFLLVGICNHLGVPRPDLETYNHFQELCTDGETTVTNITPEELESAIKDKGYYHWERKLSCCYCPTDYTIEGRHYGEKKGIVMGITTWCNMGAGQVADDETWQPRINDIKTTKFAERVSIRDGYEAQPGESLEALSERNVHLLHAKAGKKWKEGILNKKWKKEILNEKHAPKEAGFPWRRYIETWYDSSAEQIAFPYTEGVDIILE